MTSTQYHIEEYSTRNKNNYCGNNHIAIFRPPVYVYTNGSAHFYKHNQSILENYICVDRIDNENDFGGDDFTNVVALTCEKVIENTRVIVNDKVKHGPVCEQTADFCVPKCCPSNEIFHVSKRR